MNALRFRDGSPVPDDEVIYDSDVDKRYGDASRGRLAALKEKLISHLANKGRRQLGKHSADT
jgi:hypothetical protein